MTSSTSTPRADAGGALRRQWTSALRSAALGSAACLAVGCGSGATPPLRPPPVLAPPVAPVATAADAARPEIGAPTRLQHEPQIYLLLRLPGDRAHVRYTPGSLDRAANLQTRFELASRFFERWASRPIEHTSYVLQRDEWAQAGFSVPYGVPVRVGRWGIAAPAFGDDGSVELWSRLLGGELPAVAGVPLQGTPREAASVAVADVLAQLLLAEALVDELGIAGDEHWVRGLMAHVVNEALVRRLEPHRAADLDRLWEGFAAAASDGHRSARDYGPDLGLAEWLWYQVQLREGARLVVEDEGKDVVEKMLKLRRRDGGVLDGDRLLHKYPRLGDWFRATFSAVSFRRQAAG